MSKTNLNQVIDISNNDPYNATNKESKVKSNVPLTKKQLTVDEITHKHIEGGVPIPQACSEAGIQIYTYYNWKKRVEQLRKKTRSKYIAPVIIRKMPIPQTALETKTGMTRELPPQKCAIILTDTKEVYNVLKELFQ